MICMTLDCVRPTQSSVIPPFTAMLVWSAFFQFLPKCFFVIIFIYVYFIDILQDSVEMNLWCDGICNNHIIANCLQSVPVEEF